MTGPVLRSLADIRIGTRHRRELGDIDGLAQSIADVGLLHPIVVTPDGRLIAGERRFEAHKRLGCESIAVTVIDLEQVARGEYAENTFRKDFTPSEAVAIAEALEPIERAEAKARQVAHGGTAPGKHSGEIPHSVNGRALEKVARVAGKDRKTIQKAKAIVEAAAAEPEKFGKLKEDMDRTGRVDGPFKRLKVMKQAAEIRKEPPPLPGRGPYRVIVADPPWPFELDKEDPSHRATHPFPTMSIEKICAADVASIAHADCVLWLWTTNFHMRAAFAVVDAWGFQQKTILTWAKDRMARGTWLRGQTEHCLMCVRGEPVVQLTNQTTLLHGPLRADSEKPIEFYDFVEALCPAPRYADLFSRYQHNDKWDCHGDQVPEKAAAPSAAIKRLGDAHAEKLRRLNAMLPAHLQPRKKQPQKPKAAKEGKAARVMASLSPQGRPLASKTRGGGMTIPPENAASASDDDEWGTP